MATKSGVKTVLKCLPLSVLLVIGKKNGKQNHQKHLKNTTRCTFGQNIKFLPAQQLHREIVANTNPRTFWHFTLVVVDLQDLHTKSVFRYTVEHTYIHTTSQKYMRMYVHMGMELAATETDLESNCHFIIG